MPWIRKNNGLVCEVFHGPEAPKNCEAPGAWSRVKDGHADVVAFEKMQAEKFASADQRSVALARLLDALSDPEVSKRILGS